MMNDELLRDYIEVGRVNNVQTAIQTEKINSLVQSITKLDYTLNNGPITKLDKKLDRAWRVLVGLFVPTIAIALLLLKLITTKP